MTAASLKVLAIGATIAALTSCTGNDQKDSQALPVTPSPTKAGQVVIIAGNEKTKGNPTDGDFAVRTHIEPTGGLAAAEDGSIYLPVRFNGGGRIAHITKDGRLHLLGSADQGDQLIIQGQTLWHVSSGEDTFTVTKISMATGKASEYLGWASQLADPINILSTAGKKLATVQRRKLDDAWAGSVLGIRWDGVPIIANSDGELFEILGPQRLKEWKPDRYSDSISTTKGDGYQARTFAPSAIIATPPEQKLIIVGAYGFITVSKDKAAKAIKFSNSASGREVGYSSTGAETLSDGSLILVSGATTVDDGSRVLNIKPDGSAAVASWDDRQDCTSFNGTLAAISSGKPAAITRRPDGSYVVADSRCGRVYDFILPQRFAGRPLP
jgi:hypothetical protein